MTERLGSATRRLGLDSSHALTSLRFFAALYVLLFHAVPVFLPAAALPPFLRRFVSLGYVAVSFFFLLSGYILAVAYLGNRTNPPSAGGFYQARFARVYPLFVLTLLLDTPDWVVAHAREYGGYLSSGRATVGVLTAHLLMLQAWLPSLRGIDRPNWSLSVEAFFYALFPWIAPFLWRLGARTAALLSGALYISGEVLVCAARGHLSQDAIMFIPAFHLSTFLIGICLARWQSLCQRRLEKSAVAVPVLIAAVLGGAYLLLAYGNGINHVYLNDGLLTPLFILAILAVSINGRAPALLLGGRPLRLLGDSSYALYLFHVPILHYAQRLHPTPGATTFLLYLSVCLMVSVLSFKYFETPWRMRLAHRAPEPAELRGEPM